MVPEVGSISEEFFFLLEVGGSILGDREMKVIFATSLRPL